MGKIMRRAESSDDISEYEVIRRRNIEEIRQKMILSGTFKDIKTLSYQVKNNTGSDPIAAEVFDDVLNFRNVGHKTSKTKVKNTLKSVVGSKKHISTKDKHEALGVHNKRVLRKKHEIDEDYVPPRNLRSSKKVDINYDEDCENEESSEDDEPQFKRRRGLPRRAAVRAARQMSYAEVYIPSADEFIYCDYPECDKEYFEGCSIEDHQVAFVDEIDASGCLLVLPSKISKAGRGVYNGFEETIPIGIIFGPYGGEIVSVKDYKSNKESGYAWELLDSEKEKPVGYVDPGFSGDPDPIQYIFAMINSARCKADQNLVAVQYRGQVIYRVCQPIPYGKELLTYYGDSYGKDLGIKPEHYHAGKKEHACPICDLSYKYSFILNRHIKSAHGKLSYACHLCAYTATRMESLRQHRKIVHEEVKLHCCSKCNKKYSFEWMAKRHFRHVHLGLKSS